MGRLLYIINTSLDGYIADEDGNHDWAEPNEEYVTFISEVLRPCGTHLYGRRMYEAMAVWEDEKLMDAMPPYYDDFARQWRAADKLVHSRSLESVSTGRTSLEREFDAQAVRRLKASASNDLTVAGPDLASQAFEAGLVDECHLFVAPIMLGGGKHALPRKVRLRLELTQERRLSNGMVYLAYRAKQD